MSWMAALYQTYEQAMAIANLPLHHKPMPISHTVQNAHVTIVIDGNGNYCSAKVEKQSIVLPATEQSAGRSSGEAPHPLADKLQYIAGDYAIFGGVKKSYFKGYCKQLKAWANSDHSHPSVKAVLAYIEKQTIIADLIAEKILVVDDNNCLLTQWPDKENEPPVLLKSLPKEKGLFEQGGALVCWVVESDDITQAKTWLDASLQDAWVNFDALQSAKSSLCYITGLKEPIAQSHPAKLRHSGDKAKLISSNDISGFTFRGRFTDTSKSMKGNGLQAASVGSMTTQKSHNALRWLINRQGIRNGDQVVIAWAMSNADVPQPVMDKPLEFDPYDMNIQDVDFDKLSFDVDHSLNLGLDYAEKLKRYMKGFREKLAVDDQISVMIVDSATPGRMAVVYYQQYIRNDYLDKITHWHNDFAWPRYKILKASYQPRSIMAAPLFREIAKCAYGKNIKDTLKKQVFERLLPCVTEKSAFPKDIFEMCFSAACNPLAKRQDEKFSNLSSERSAWLNDVAITCALFRGFSKRSSYTLTKDYPMSLDVNYKSTDYLFGRLLAVAEKIESFALSLTEENRLTNAERFFQRFSKFPYSTWLQLSDALVPYQHRLNNKHSHYNKAYKFLIIEIADKFEINDYKSNKQLTGEFLLGYYAQSKWLNDHKLKKDLWVLKEQQVDGNNIETVEGE